jgi:hypothetical protein
MTVLVVAGAYVSVMLIRFDSILLETFMVYPNLGGSGRIETDALTTWFGPPSAA